ncbi:hypothetical protein MF672_016060 [Actinomadura sp. ATCC 31491]|uniref:Uncharacterized protein n=1 Tax=Actinomadura luzonensis TaxID=2805427 RepID=A0ABT0FSG7_9ACTN|nr:hypothetical protein [Actinomadura luzonensis]MCK2215292.1 hypothetical protein [Actinomadura luzonensis]
MLPERPLIDLRTKVKGKVLLQHVADSGHQTKWAGKVKAGDFYKVAVDCVGSRGMLVIVPQKGWKSARQCSAGFGAYTVDHRYASESAVETVRIEAPSGARWAVLVVASGPST